MRGLILTSLHQECFYDGLAPEGDRPFQATVVGVFDAGWKLESRSQEPEGDSVTWYVVNHDHSLTQWGFRSANGENAVTLQYSKLNEPITIEPPL